MDVFTPEQRSRVMARVRSGDTAPEMTVRRLVHALGYRFRLHRRDLPGVPDLVFVSRRKIVFVHGCFWHQHHCKRGNRVPATRQDYWLPKLARNVARDHRTRRKLRRMGWGVMTVWECQIRTDRLDVLTRRIAAFLERP
jgi:DNA mismatch endonuclease, patch repair protein